MAAEPGRKKEDYRAEMPPLEAGDYLVDALFRIGPTLIGALGNAPLTQEEIFSWQLNTGVRLTPWDAEALHRLSLEYLVESQAAVKRDATAPWAAPNAKPQPTDLQLRLRALAQI